MQVQGCRPVPVRPRTAPRAARKAGRVRGVQCRVLITYANVRSWRKAPLDAGLGPVTVAKSYRLLQAIMNTAVEDELIGRNPCRIKGAGVERSPERPVATIEQVYALADAIEPRYRALVLLATFASLRWGELIALRKGDLDLDGSVDVDMAYSEDRGKVILGPPKSDAGKRVVSFPEVIAPDRPAPVQPRPAFRAAG